MNDDLLISLRKYSPRDGRDPLENFITEAFVWLLKSNDEFSAVFLKMISKSGALDVQDYPDKNFSGAHWETQSNFNGFYPDMVAILDGVAFVFENKAWARLHKNQLENYRKHELNGVEKTFIILITATEKQHEQEPDLALCWRDVYRLMEDFLAENQGDSVFQSFMKLLEHEGMGPQAPISHESILSYFAARDFKKNIEQLIKLANAREYWQKFIPDESLALSPNRNPRGGIFGEGWGRIGLNLIGEDRVSAWTPGLFVGFLLDGEIDHKTKPSAPKSGPDFCVIIDFAKEYHREYPKHPLYQSLVNRLKVVFKQPHIQYQLYCHLEEDPGSAKNPWHPVHIRMPMLELFRGTQTIEQQLEVFLKASGDILEILFEGTEIQELREELRESIHGAQLPRAS